MKRLRIALFTFLILLMGCLNNPKSGDELLIGDVEVGELPDPDSLVCDPFDQINEDGSSSINNGIKGSVYYLTDDMPRYRSVIDLINNGIALEGVQLYFSQLNVPTRPFDRGFVTQSGVVLTNINNEPLYEYFALDFSGKITLSGDMAPGPYQMAILADDGAVLDMDLGQGMETIINNDGTHATKMACATKAIELHTGDAIEFNLKYHQGPRFHIALVVMMRPWPANEAEVQDPLCGAQGNSVFFDSRQDPPLPSQNYHNLLSRGWFVVPKESFRLPGDEIENPCNLPPPQILEYRVVSKTATSLTIDWKTDLPSTSQVRYLNATTQEEKFTDINNSLVTQHSVTVTGLQPFTVYRLKVLSKSKGNKEGVSGEFSVRTNWE